MKQNIIFKIFLILSVVILVGCGRTEDTSSSESSESVSNESEETSDRTHGEYESSEIESVAPDNSEPEASLPEESQDESDRTHGEYESSEIESVAPDNSEPEVSLPEESQDESGRTHGEYESEPETSTPVESEPEANLPEESQDESDRTHGEYESEPETSVPVESENIEEDSSLDHVCVFDKVTYIHKPTCNGSGFTEYSCACGETERRDYVDNLGGHIEGEWVVWQEATWDQKGYRDLYCTRCEEVIKTEVIPRLCPDGIYDVEANSSTAYLVEERILYYINQYRVAEGTPEATALLNGKTYQYAKLRAEQLVTNFAHDMDDIHKVATQLEFGHYIPEQPEYAYDWATETLIETGNTIPAYYSPGCSEAITKGYGGQIVEDVAKNFAKTCYESKSHWSYVGAETTQHITIGAIQDGGHWYICIATSSSDQYD